MNIQNWFSQQPPWKGSTRMILVFLMRIIVHTIRHAHSADLGMHILMHEQCIQLLLLKLYKQMFKNQMHTSKIIKSSEVIE